MSSGTENGAELRYLALLGKVLKRGEPRESRSGTTVSLFAENLKFNLQHSFPLLSTKRMFWRGIVEEFLFFLKGDTDTTHLQDKKVNIWKGNTSKEFLKSRGLNYAPGVMGPMYGYQWRYYNAPYQVDLTGRPLAPRGHRSDCSSC